MKPTILEAAAIHVLTASGAALGLLALDAADRGEWRMMFIWLGLALLVDGIDGPLARHIDVKRILPRWSGERLDLIVDYLTYVIVPAFALTQADLVPPGWRLPAAIAIALSSLFHFADTESKTRNDNFVGFPAIWNIAVFYLFVFALPPYLALAAIAALVAATFVPLLYVHPVRTRAWRPLTVSVTVLWGACAIAALFFPFPAPIWVQIGLGCAALYLLAASIAVTWQSKRQARSA